MIDWSEIIHGIAAHSPHSMAMSVIWAKGSPISLVTAQGSGEEVVLGM